MSLAARVLSFPAALSVIALALTPGLAHAENAGPNACAVKADHTVWCWGSNTGNAEAGFAVGVPVRVAGIDDAVSVTGPFGVTCVLHAGGTVSCWGSNYSGELGDGTNVASRTPVAVSGLVDAVAVSSGGGSSCAVRATGGVVCWGGNDRGQLGDGTTTNSNTPVAVGGITDATSISVGTGSNACAVVSSGEVRCWGSDQLGQLGDGATSNSPTSTPVTVPGITNAVSVSAGAITGCAILDDGTVRCWGTNYYGALGDGSSGSGTSGPVAVAGITNATSIKAGYRSCAGLASGEVRCWGITDANDAIAGDPTAGARVPETVPGISDAAFLLDGLYGTCAVRLHHKVACWGYQVGGELGNNHPGWLAGPAAPVIGLSSASAVSVSDSFACARQTDAVLRCWGAGPFGDGATQYRRLSSQASSVPGATDVGAVATGWQHGCAVVGGGTVKCLGRNGSGQLGDGDTSNSYFVPVTVSGLTDAATLAAGHEFTCALRTGGTVVCWGDNFYGQLGDGTTAQSTTPVGVSGLSSVTAIAAGESTACALRSDKTVACWGSGFSSGGPATVAGVTDAVKIAVGNDYACAVRDDEDATAVCWGRNGSGQLGDGTETDSATPVTVSGLTGGSSIAATRYGACAVVTTGGVRCWGDGPATYSRPFGADTTSLVTVPGITNATQISLGRDTACALESDASVVCWGSGGFYGLFGDGDGPFGHGRQVTATDVIGLADVFTGRPEPIDPAPDEPPVVDPLVVDPPKVLPPKATPYVVFTGRKVVLTKLPVLSKSKRCPARVTVGVQVKGAKMVLTMLAVQRAGKGCTVSGTVRLGPKFAKVKSVKLRLSGAGVKPAKRTVTRTAL